ncbi:hypothetical protein HS088_TW22G00981 [Tripterygium wilfordii]|uniref:Protein BIG GRAIN 1-like B n=1 Tax=Tripterygium wilfordii TaxID=458696 RepID=A0A7J7BZE9_TRIWF|nr:protein BIG GRAIN 1-like B [Tripterygium wilfordii]KAF5727290.1 hypothetical protein HS088_TW22G00981 [Tripterygium wilfordii]
MDVRWEKTLRDQDHRNRHNPSFSSTLLDAIYRSIDEPAANDNDNNNNNKRDHENMIFYKESITRKKHFVEKKNVSSEKVVLRRKSMEDLDKKVKHQRNLESVLLNSSSTSSDSSYGGGFSSSESESFSRRKPIRTSVSSSTTRPEMMHKGVSFGNKTKTKALKIYGDLNKKVKQPISPGGRLATFLNSIFTAGNAKKAKIKSKSSDKASSLSSTCSSASSFSRSCLSNTPSSRGTNGVKRSVRFCPVSVIVDEECRPCGHKALYENKETSCNSTSALMAVVKKSNTTINEELRLHIMSENHRVKEVARDLLKNYRKIDHDSDDDDDDDAASYSSSDLFELDNLSAIGIERYREELPVYETTHLDTNLAIANGLIM